MRAHLCFIGGGDRIERYCPGCIDERRAMKMNIVYCHVGYDQASAHSRIKPNMPDNMRLTFNDAGVLIRADVLSPIERRVKAMRAADVEQSDREYILSTQRKGKI
jgi:hypothetical protein